MTMGPYGDGTLTEEQLEYIRKHQPDVVGAGQDMTRQMALADQLRTHDRGRLDWASQIGRAVQGLHGGYLEGERNKRQAQTRKAVGDFWGNMPGAQQRAAAPPVQDPVMSMPMVGQDFQMGGAPRMANTRAFPGPQRLNPEDDPLMQLAYGGRY
jgi:hypothetical protein